TAYKMVLQEPTAIFSVVYLGIFASVLAFFCMNYMLGKLPAANACIFNNMATVISIFAGILVLHEKMHWYQMVGGILIISGVWGTNYYEGKG
ncbi:EamA family transporter, partial [Anaerotignum sp.]|uniref:EamA family transporter n=1 Tax=Anaerotignum sp. TaxID=2039241 RepID=UPI003735AFCF